MRYLSICLLAFTIATTSTHVAAWGETGHQLVCELAYEGLSDKGKRFVEETLAMGKELDGNGKNDFAQACLWPDKARFADYKGTYEQHFINIPRGEKDINFARDCAALDCIAVGIQRSLVYLSKTPEGAREEARKAAALRFLGHFVADLHQPLHVSHGEDWGGNRIRVSFFDEQTNLHAVWDTALVSRSGLEYPASLVFLGGIDMEVGSPNVLSWMRDSFKLARFHAYMGMDGTPVKSGDSLGIDYLERSKPVVIEQIRKASVRLTYLIEKLAEGKLNTNILIE